MPEKLYQRFSVNQEEPDSENSFNIPQYLNYHGYDYTQVCRGDKSCLHRQTLEGKTISFEVILIRIQPKTTLYGKVYPAREHWPKDTDFGMTAWAYWTLERAMEKYNELER